MLGGSLPAAGSLGTRGLLWGGPRAQEAASGAEWTKQAVGRVLNPNDLARGTAHLAPLLPRVLATSPTQHRSSVSPFRPGSQLLFPAPGPAHSEHPQPGS